MVLKLKKLDFRKLAQRAGAAAEDKKAKAVDILDIRKDSDLAEFILIAEVESSAQMRAVEGAVEEALKEAGVQPLRREGRRHQRWMALDYGGLLVHIMMSDARAFYRLEQMWEHAKKIS